MELVEQHKTRIHKERKLRNMKIILERGLFQSSIGKRINADVNGSLNILRKVAGDEFLASRGFVVNPVKISYDFTKSLVEFL